MQVEHLALLDIAEAGLHDLGLQLDAMNPGLSRALVVGDICDEALLDEVFRNHGPQIIFHAAACKHVSLMEHNPLAAAKANVLGTKCLLESAIRWRAERLIAISTDKAVAPASIMGATKRIVELLVIANHSPARINAVRLGNVLGSTGSIVPLLQQQIAQGGPITLTDAGCTRFFVTSDKAVRAVLSVLLVEHPSSVLVSQSGEACSIVKLADFLLKCADMDRQSIRFEFSQLRPGEKLAEQMLSETEITEPSGVQGLLAITSASSTRSLSDNVARVKDAIECRDLAALLRAVSKLVPDYTPSDHLLRQVKLGAMETMMA
jgi:FlaA1/EpsC-like NDP-sugar epimerase